VAVTVQVPTVLLALYVAENWPLLLVVPVAAVVNDPHAAAGLPLRVNATGSAIAGAPVLDVTVAVTVEGVAPSAGTLVGLAVTLTPEACPKKPERSTTRSVDPPLL
jgi:hypothetical protein